MGMYLVVDDWKTFIGKKENRFELRQDDKKLEFSADDVGQIIIIAASSISIGAIKLAMEKDIDIVFIGRFGEPIGRIYPCKLGGTTLTRKKQLEAYFSGKGFELQRFLVECQRFRLLQNQNSRTWECNVHFKLLRVRIGRLIFRISDFLVW